MIRFAIASLLISACCGLSIVSLFDVSPTQVLGRVTHNQILDVEQTVFLHIQDQADESKRRLDQLQEDGWRIVDSLHCTGSGTKGLYALLLLERPRRYAAAAEPKQGLPAEGKEAPID